MLMFATFGTVVVRRRLARPPAARRTTTMTVLGLLLLLGGLRQVRPGAAAVLAARRDGGPDPGLGADPRGDDGDRGRLPGRPLATSSTTSTEAAQTAVVVVGAVTLLWGAVIGCAKDDIKKALAGSTMSQIGYMMLAAGLGPAGYAFAIFHLLTHGFFKANMFLGAGSVMHAHGRRRRHAPLRRAAQGHAGHVPDLRAAATSRSSASRRSPASGPRTRSSRRRSATTWSSGSAPLLGAGVTAFYMTRLMLMTFFGEKRWAEGVHPHESPKVMTVPLIVLAALSVARRAAAARRLDRRLARAGRRRRGPRTTSRSRRWCSSLIVLVVVVVGVGDRLADRRPPRRARAPRRPRSRSFTTRRPRRPLRRRDQRGAADAARATGSSPALVDLRRPTVVDGVVDGHRRRLRRHVRHGSGGCRPASSAPTRCRCSAAPPLVVLALLAVNLA